MTVAKLDVHLNSGDDKFNPGYLVWAVDHHLYPIKQIAVQNSNAGWGTPKQQLKNIRILFKRNSKTY